MISHGLYQQNKNLISFYEQKDMLSQHLLMGAEYERDICNSKGLIIHRENSYSSLLAVPVPRTDACKKSCRFLCETASCCKTLGS